MAKKKHEEHENHERWLVSYADFITLLFAFFVVMYSVSSVNEGKYRTVSESIKAALNPIVSPPTSTAAFNVGNNKPALMAPNLPGAKEVAIRRLRELVRTIQAVPQFAPIHMMEKRDGNIVITIPDQVLFNSGDATVKPEALSFLQGLAQAMIELNRQVRVEGHTDNVPMRTAQFPSNWELSASRAVIVVRVFSELYGVPSHHLAALGYADSRPLTANLNPEQRAKNRRVEVIILEDPQSAPAVNTLSSQSEHATSEEDNLPAVLQPPAPDKSMVPN